MWRQTIALGRTANHRRFNTTVTNTVQSNVTASQWHHYGQYLTSLAPALIQSYSVDHAEELTLHTAPSTLVPLLQLLRDHTHTRYEQLMDVCGVDYPTKKHRFEIVYNLLSIRHNARIRVKTYCDEITPVPTATGLFSSANWMEREVYDMFGVIFEGHADLRRILTDYGFEGYPLRKDFPLTGYREVRYDEEKKRVVSEPVELAQAFRNFEAQSPWEQTGKGIAPEIQALHKKE